MDWTRKWEELKGGDGGAWSETVATPEHLIVYLAHVITHHDIRYPIHSEGFLAALQDAPLDVWAKWFTERAAVPTAAIPEPAPKQCDKGHVMFGNATPMCYRCYTGL